MKYDTLEDLVAYLREYSAEYLSDTGIHVRFEFPEAEEVAGELAMSMNTVRTHVWHIYRKLQVHNRTEAILKGFPQHPSWS